MRTRFLSLSALFLLLALQAAASCPMHPNAPPELSADHSCCRIAQEEWDGATQSAQPSELSLFQIDSLWQNQRGETADLDQIAGRPQLVTMAYTSCQYACPRLFTDLKAIETKLADRHGADFGITVITFDPERDTPEQLREYASSQKLDTERWTFLRGDPSDILELANLLGIRYQELPNGEFSHSNIITLLNAKGEVLARVDGLGADPAPLLKALEQLR